MALIRLKNIGKIYASEGSVAVGIRGVNLSFDRGEFVAVTGKSGSGKSTLLNVISGMDSYEEGELFIEGSPTSHYLQKDWEEYREKYISFIFQEYNIIDSFTVLQNVELSLMGIQDPRERRRRAVELITRVGMRSHMHHKGSKLSGGQKQRTVIARALAKDSPVILADEPTGNLDSQTSAEIIDLLREVSRDKLVIVVTHNFDQLAQYATRHIRIFDGAVESDEVIVPSAAKPSADLSGEAGDAGQTAEKTFRERAGFVVRNGFMLGRSIFTAKPKLTVFICFLLILSTVGIYVVSSLCMDALSLFEKKRMFRPSDGRLVVVKTEGTPFTDEELEKIKRETGASDYLHYDLMLDSDIGINVDQIPWSSRVSPYLSLQIIIDGRPGKPAAGTYPEKKDECFLWLPVGYKPYFGSGELKIRKLSQKNWLSDSRSAALNLTVSGVGYYPDNNRDPVMCVTAEGFRYLTLYRYVTSGSGGLPFIPDGALSGERPDYGSENNPIDLFRYASPDLFEQNYMSGYRQASFFYRNNSEAAKAAEKLREDDIIAVLSNATYDSGALDLVEAMLAGFGSLVLWIVSVLFLAFFVRVCTSRSVATFRPDMAIMRSMGIPVSVIRAGIYFRMFISLIPAFVCVIALGLLISFNPVFNATFRFVYGWVYLLIFGGMIIMVLAVTKSQIRKLFGESVKKSIRGGERE